jgi:hypothetical protein
MGYIATVVTGVYLASKQRCSNTCFYLHVVCSTSAAEARDGKAYGVAKCHLFDTDLHWDKRYKTNGYKRCKACKEGECWTNA